jgi:hypothetical protein
MTTKILRLAIAGVFLTITVFTRAAIAPAENLLPADTIAFFTVPDCAVFRAVAKVSPQLMCWNDPAMKPFHDKFMGKLTEKFLAPLEKDLGLKADDFADLPQGQFTVAVTVNGSNGHDDIPPGLLLLLDTRDKSAQLKTNLAALTKKMTDNGRTLRTVKIRSLPFTVVTLASNDLNNIFGARPQVSEIGKEPKPEKPVDIYFTQFESLLIAANSELLADAVAAHLTGGSAPALTDDATFAADKLSQFRDAPTYYGWFNGKVFFNLLAQASDETTGDAANGLLPKFSAAKILGATGLGNLKSVSFAMRDGRDGAVAEMHLTSPADSRGGILKILSLPAKDSSPPTFVPADATKFTRARLDGKQTWTDLLKMLAEISPQALAAINSIVDVANASAQQKDPAFDLRKNLFGNLGDDIISYSKAATGDTLAAISHPPSIVLVATPNAEQMIQAVKVIGAMAGPQDSSVQPRDFHGHKIHSITPRAQRTASGATVPQSPLLLSSANGYVAFTTDAGMLEEFLRNTDGSSKPLRENAGLRDAATRVGGTGTGLFSYQDQRAEMRMAFKLFKSAVDSDPMMKLFPRELRDWADFSLLPEYDKVAKYFYLSVFTGSANASGLSVKVFTPRPPQLN